MSGSNTICVVTALLETGALPMVEPTTVITLETAAGLVRAEASCRDGRCQRVTFTGVPSFVEVLDVLLEVPGVGNITVDVAYGGCFYVLVDATELGVRLTREGARDVVERAELVMAAAEQQLTVRHPEIPEIDFVSYVMVTGEDDPAAGRLRGATALSGRVDRSPCGTGTSARLACLAARWSGPPRCPLRRDPIDRQRVRRHGQGDGDSRWTARRRAQHLRAGLDLRHPDGGRRPRRPLPDGFHPERPVGPADGRVISGRSAVGIERRQVEGRATLDDQVGHHRRRGRREREAEHAVAAGDDHVREAAGAPEER